MDNLKESQGKVFVGTAGWDYPDWRGLFFPERMPRGVHPLSYLANYFDTVEINSTFYRPARPQSAIRWIQYVAHAPDFAFTVKLWRRFTHDRSTFPEPCEIELFKAGITPLLEEGKLGGLLIQFPWSFRNQGENRAWLERVFGFFEEYPLILEVRHASWNQPEVYKFLLKRQIALCNIDQPIFHDSLGPGGKLTARIGYVRLHGQNYADWFREGAGRDARYNYLYTEEELEPWVEKIRQMRQMANRLFVITNNHYRGQAAVNALQLLHKISGNKVKVPSPLKKAYPKLGSISTDSGPGEQKPLPGF